MPNGSKYEQLCSTAAMEHFLEELRIRLLELA